MKPGKAPAARKDPEVAVVGAIDRIALRLTKLSAILTLSHPLLLCAGVLPEERADTLYHSYKGGGVQVDGPSVLIRKNVGDSASIVGNYYVDHVSSASIDVVTQGSPYKEERRQKSLGFDYLKGDVSLILGYINSEESDYSANTANFSVSQDMFGDLTTITMGYTRGWDTVRRNGQPGFAEPATRNNYQLELSQILTRDALVGISFETITDEGYLHNPYRSVRYLDSTNPIGYSYEPEVYPRTHTSTAVTLQARYYLPYRAAIHGEYRLYNDSWGVTASNVQLDYTHPVGNDWTFELKYRIYSQTAADFYSDLFPRINSQNFLARDKELSALTNQTAGAGISYEFAKKKWEYIDKGSLNLYYDHIQFNYDNFRDVTASNSVGNEPLYKFSADVLRLFLSIWY
jgi:Protein of unknown function (DUF3570)